MYPSTHLRILAARTFWHIRLFMPYTTLFSCSPREQRSHRASGCSVLVAGGTPRIARGSFSARRVASFAGKERAREREYVSRCTFPNDRAPTKPSPPPFPIFARFLSLSLIHTTAPFYPRPPPPDCLRPFLFRFATLTGGKNSVVART